MARPRIEPGWPDQEVVRDEFRRYLHRFHSQKDAAKFLGVNQQRVSAWLNGEQKISEWMCGVLGYKRMYVQVGTMGVMPTGKRA
jgi:plasmid maintenance system antidote protein VapI